MSRPTMERAIEAIDAGDLDEAKRLCEAMKWESQFMHDLLVDGVAGLISFVKEKLGDDGVEEAWEYSLERSWKKAGRDDRPAPTARPIAEALAATWRAHSTSGVGPEPGRVRDRRGRREAHLHDEPVRVGPAAVAQPPLRAGRLGRDRRGARLELRPRGLPALLHPLRVHERDAADPLDRPPGVSRRTRPRTSTAIRAPGTGTRTRPTSPSATSRAMGSSAATDAARSGRRPRRARRGRRGPGRGRAERDRGRRLAADVPGRGRGEPRWVLRREPAGGDVVRLRSRSSSRRSPPPTSPASRWPRTVRFEPAGGRFGAGAGYADGVRRRDLRRAAGAAARRARGRPRAAPGPARRGARPDPLASSPARSRGSPGERATRRSRRASCGRRRSTRSASRCRRSRPACAGCALNAPPAGRAARSSTATSGSATSSSTSTGSPR